MISLIICCRNGNISQTLRNNIDETIGIKYELVIIDNSQNTYTIFSAYNEGVKRSLYPNLCFMHDDLFFYTQNWGKNVINHLDDKRIGLIGVIGSHFLPDTLAYWHDIRPYYLSGIVPIQENDKFEYIQYIEGKKNNIEAVIVDGMWFCLRKKDFDTIHFDTKLFNGYHMYDMDICMQVIMILKKQVHVIFDIRIAHFSLWETSESFCNNLKVFNQKWKDYLPIHRGIEVENEICKSISYMPRKYYAMCELYYEALKIKESRTYKLGNFILTPFRLIRNLFAR